MQELIDKILYGTWCNEVYESCPDGVMCTCSPILPPMIIFLPLFGFVAGLTLWKMFTTKKLVGNSKIDEGHV